MGKRGRPAHPDILTPREWEVLGLLRERLTNEQIADRLGISLDGAKYHVSSILSKLGASTREEAAAWRATELRPWWKRFIAVPAAILGAATLVGATAGLAIVAWGVVETTGPAQEMAEPTVTPGEESIERTRSPEEATAIDTVLEGMRAEACNRPDASTAKAALTTTDGVSRILRERMFGEVFGPSETVPPLVGLPDDILRDSTHTPVWLVEVKTDKSAPIPGDREKCEAESTPMLVFMLVVDGDVKVSFARPANGSTIGSGTRLVESPMPTGIANDLVQFTEPVTEVMGNLVALRLDYPNAEGVWAGDWVDVRATFDGALTTIVENVQALSVGSTPNSTYKEVALAVTPEQAQLITSAKEKASSLSLSASSNPRNP